MLLQNRARAPFCALVFETGATFSNQLTTDRPAGQVEIRLEPYFLGHELYRSFFLFKRRRKNQFLNAILMQF